MVRTGDSKKNPVLYQQPQIPHKVWLEVRRDAAGRVRLPRDSERGGGLQRRSCVPCSRLPGMKE